MSFDIFHFVMGAPLPLGGVGVVMGAPLPLGGVGGGRSSEGSPLSFSLRGCASTTHRAAKPQKRQEKELPTSPSPNPSQRGGGRLKHCFSGNSRMPNRKRFGLLADEESE